MTELPATAELSVECVPEEAELSTAEEVLSIGAQAVVRCGEPAVEVPLGG